MALSLVKHQQEKDPGDTSVRVLLLDTPENLGVDFLQSLQRQDMKLMFERVNDKAALFSALKKGNWDILLVCDQVKVPGVEETLTCLAQLDCETAFVLLSKETLCIESLTTAYRKGIAAVVSAQHPDFSHEVFAREAERSRRNFQLSQLNQEKFELKRHCQQLMSGTEEALAYLQDGIHVFGNDSYLKLLGYRDMDDLLVMPFIDIVSSEMRDKTKQHLLDYQHKVRLQPDCDNLEIRELFVVGTGAKEGVLQLSASFKPVIYEGEDCIQVLLKTRQTPESRDEAAAAEGLGYPLFVTHLDNFATQARNAGTVLGHVAHVRGSGFEHYIAARGFGSLNGKLKALASELKACLQREDLLIRFTENSFLILFKQPAHPAIAGLPTLLGKFEVALNREIEASETLICLNHVVVPVDAAVASAEQLIKGFLQDSARSDSKPAHAPDAPVAALDASQTTQAEAPAPPAPVQSQPVAANKPVDAVQIPTLTQKPVNAENLNLQQLNAALVDNALVLKYEAVISVTDIETEFHDISVFLQGSNEAVSSRALCTNPEAGTLAARLDQWALHNTLAVIANLYKQGQEYPVLLSLSARSLANKRLVEFVSGELAVHGLPGAMLALDFSLQDLNRDATASIEQLRKLKTEGVLLCVSDVINLADLKEISGSIRFDMVALQKGLVKHAVRDEATFALLQQGVQKLHAMRAKVLAGAINSNDELSVCCRAGIDLVKGKYIQKIPLKLDADSLAEEMMI